MLCFCGSFGRSVRRKKPRTNNYPGGADIIVVGGGDEVGFVVVAAIVVVADISPRPHPCCVSSLFLVFVVAALEVYSFNGQGNS